MKTKLDTNRLGPLIEHVSESTSIKGFWCFDVLVVSGENSMIDIYFAKRMKLTIYNIPPVKRIKIDTTFAKIPWTIQKRFTPLERTK